MAFSGNQKTALSSMALPGMVKAFVAKQAESIAVGGVEYKADNRKPHHRLQDRKPHYISRGTD